MSLLKLKLAPNIIITGLKVLVKGVATFAIWTPTTCVDHVNLAAQIGK